jgi:hypothetical protein
MDFFGAAGLPWIAGGTSRGGGGGHHHNNNKRAHPTKQHHEEEEEEEEEEEQDDEPQEPSPHHHNANPKALLIMLQQQQQQKAAAAGQHKSKQQKEQEEEEPSSSTDSTSSAANTSSSSSSSSAKDTTPGKSPDISDFSTKVKLPTVDVINEAFTHLTDFTLAKMLPPDLKNPLQGLGAELREKVDLVNVNLEHNIRELMSNESTKGEIADIQAALVSIVSRNDSYLLTPEQQKVDRDRLTQRAMAKISKPILRFYPHLLQAIRALLAYDTTFKNETFISANHTSAIIYREWMRVLGYLQSIHSVIVFAAKQQLISLDNFPVNLSEFSDYTQSEIDTLQASILKTEDALSHLEATEIERKKAYSEVASKFKGLDTDISRKRSLLASMREKLADHTDPARIAHQNIIRIQQAYHLVGS